MIVSLQARSAIAWSTLRYFLYTAAVEPVYYGRFQATISWLNRQVAGGLVYNLLVFIERSVVSIQVAIKTGSTV